MKQFAKRTISMLLSLLMIITMIPSFAITASAADVDNARNGLSVDVVNNIKPETFNSKGTYKTFSNDLAGNLIYQSTTSNFEKDYDNNYVGGSFISQNVTILAYDGSNQAFYPTYVKLWPKGKNNIVMRYVRFNPNGTSPFELKSNWSGAGYYTNDNDITVVNKQQQLNIVDDGRGSGNKNTVSGYEFLFGTSTGYGVGSGYGYFWTNKLYYNGSGDTTNYYEKYTGDKIRFEECHRNDNWGWGDRKSNHYATNSVYILNYKPLYEILSKSSKVTVNGNAYDFSSLFSEVYNNEYKYTDASLIAYYNAVKQIKNINVKNSFNGVNDSTADAKVQSVAESIKSAVNTYTSAAQSLTLNNFTVKFERVNGTSTSQTIVAGNPLSSKFNSIPNLSQTGNYSNNDQKTHRVYSWKTAEGVSANLALVVKSDTTFVETPTNVDCSWNSGVETTPSTCTATGVKTYTCSVCGGTKTETIPMKEHTWGDYVEAGSTYHARQCTVCKTWESYEDEAHKHNSAGTLDAVVATCTSTGLTEGKKCSVCGRIMVDQTTIPATGHTYAVSGNRYVCTNDETHIKTDANTGEQIDLDSYNAVVTEANAKLQETDVYTAESLKSLQDALELPANQLDALKDNTQRDVDEKITAIQTAIGKLELLVIKYHVVFMYQFEGEEAVEVINDSYDKDDEIELKVPEEALAQGVVYKWYTSTTDGDKPYATSVNSTTLIVNRNITIVAKLQKNTTDIENAVKVNLLDKSGRTIAIGYTSSSSITLNESSITVDGNEFEAKQIPFYNVRGFKVDGGAAVSSTTYEIPVGVTEINVMPNYVAEKKIVITVNSDVKLNGKSVSSYEATWNQAITMTSETEVNWYANGKLIAQGTTYKFCANTDVTITADTTAPVTIDPSVEIGYFNYDSSLNKVTVVSNFYAPQGTISDAGVILSTKTGDIETLKKATGGVFKVNSSNFTSNGNQVRISVSRTATTHFTMYALAFVVVDGVTYYADSVSTCVY